MSTLVERFVHLKTQVGGNREKTKFEHMMGHPKEDLMRITMPPAHIRRIVAEVDFAIQLSVEHAGAFDTAVDAALVLLENAMAADGVLIASACQAAEAALLPLQKAAKEYRLICAAHAHIDMNWMWGFEETVAATLATFRTMLAIMREYPDFCYSQSQASVYRIVEEYAPEMMDEIRARIREGRWEITAAAWVETDKNMPDTESLLRHIKDTRAYLRDVWQVDPDSLQIDFSPDTFGHSACLPELNHFGNVKYYYHCRGFQTEHVLYRWRAPSGRELLMYREPYWYNSGITPDIGTGLIGVSKHSGGLKTGLIVYGVGDHGGGPSRRDIESIIEMQAWPIFPAVTFGTFKEYFAAAETVREQVEVVDHELNFIFPGCYTTQSRIKRGNRRSEAALLDAEALSAMAHLCTGMDMPQKQLTKAWENVLFTHFHDILTGSCVQDSREYAMGLYQQAIATAQTAQERATRLLSCEIDTSSIVCDDAAGTISEGAGVGYGLGHLAGIPREERGRGRVRIFHVFNPLPTLREETIELTVWDWLYDLSRLTFTDETGATLPFQLVDEDVKNYWSHKYFRVLVRLQVPALGYRTLVLNEVPKTCYPTYYLLDERIHKPQDGFVLENEYIRATFSRSGALVSLFDKQAGAERIPEKDAAGLRVVMTESATSDAWLIGRYLSETRVDDTVEVKAFSGELRQGLTIRQRMLSSTAEITATLDKGAKELAFTIEVDWHEYAPKEVPVPVLLFSVPLNAAPDCIRMDVPAGEISRNQRGQDMPGLTHAAAVYGARALEMVTDCKYGYRAQDDVLSSTLINSANSPDPYPERGKHFIRLWLRAGDATPKALKDAAVALNHPLSYQSATSHAGKLPASGSLMACEAGSAVVSSVGIASDGALLVRLYEAAGQASQVTLQLPFEAKRAILVNLDECEQGTAKVDGRSVTFEIAPYHIAAVKAYR